MAGQCFRTVVKSLNVPAEWAPECRDAYRPDGSIRIVGLSDGEIIRRVPGKTDPKARLEIRGARGELMWMLNGRLPGTAVQTIVFPEAGRYDITALDDFGHYDRVSVSVMPARE